jgi:hypothetical protein
MVMPAARTRRPQSMKTVRVPVQLKLSSWECEVHTIGIVKHLREDDVGSSVDLLPEMVHLLLGRLAMRMSLGEASDL